MIYDFVIVGSGTSGGVLAYYLQKSGKKVLLLEAGNTYNKNTFPDNEMDYNAQLFWKGAFDMNTDASFIFLRGKLLGGGSVVNQALMDRFDEYALKIWREVSDIDFFTEEALDSHYTAIEEILSLQKMDEDGWNRNAKLYTKGFNKIGLKWEHLKRAQSNCNNDNDCIVCLGGCPRDSKQSTLITFIRMAQELGLEIVDNTEIKSVDYLEKTVIVKGLHKKTKDIEFEAKKVILASGSIGTTSILLQSGFKKTLPHLGRDFYCHPQSMHFAKFSDPVDAHKGQFQGVKSNDFKTRDLGFKLENVYAPPIALSILFPQLGKKHQEIMRNYRNYACIEIALKDSNPGEIKIDKKGNIVYDKRLGKDDKKALKAGKNMVKEIFQAMYPEEIIMTNFLFGLHLQGGCAMGSDKSKSVVNEKFEVHGYPNLYVADSSIFPRASGINPALTIMALAHKLSKQLGGSD